MGAAAREHAAEHYSIEAFVDGHCAAVDQALELAAR